MSITQFFSTIKESNYDFIEIYKQAPNETLILFGIIFVLFLIVFFLIRSSIKTSGAIKVVNKLPQANSYEEYNQNISSLIQELPKRGEKVANSLNANKEHILFRVSKFLPNMSIKEKIQTYLELSANYEKIAQASTKYKNEELTFFYEDKSKELVEVNLLEEISYYYENVYLSPDEVENINSIVKYANTLENPDLIIEPMINTINRFSYGYNIDLFRFIEQLDEKESKQIYTNCVERIDQLFQSGQGEISINILDYLFEKNEKQRVYDYISSLELPSYLQQLHDLYFDKKDDINLDLAFIANSTKIEQEYKKYIDESLTANWRDEKHIEFISNAKGVLEILGHVEYRSLIQRIDNLRNEEKITKRVEEALAIAKRAETIALEAKSLNKKPISSSLKIPKDI